MRGSRFVRAISVGGAMLGGCAPSAPPPSKPVVASPAPEQRARRPSELREEAEPVAPQLRTGKIQPIEHTQPLALKVRRHAIDGDEQLLEVVLPDYATESPGDVFWSGTEARINGSRAPFQLVSRGKAGEMLLWLRRPKADLNTELMGDAYTPAVGAQPGHHFRFAAPAPVGGVSPELAGQWAAAAVEYLSSRGGVFGVSSAARLQARYKLAGAPPRSYVDTGSGNEFVDLMDTFAGRAALQAALATHRGSVFSAAKQARNLAIKDLKPPALARQPWAELLRRLGKQTPDEPLAKAVPADFYFVRAQSFGALSELLSFVENFGAPAADAFDNASVERRTLSRYLAELGMEAGELSRILGPEVVRDFAVTGSDPYIHEGSDVTLIFRLKSALLFRAALLKALATHGAAHGGTQSSSFNHEGVTVEVARSPDGRVRQHHAVVSGLELVSNSPAAIKRVISTIIGKAPPLADEPDFRYMLARDAEVPADLLGFVGDRFVETVVGPVQKIAEARRQIALAELTAPPLAALLFGWVHGKSPADARELWRSGLLGPRELQHGDGARIEWSPGGTPRSAWGTPAALEPLIDLAAPVKVSLSERSSYAEFAGGYERYWSQYIDPIAIRASNVRRGDSKGLHAELRVLPLVPADAASRFDLGADGRVAPSELASGARLSLGIGETSPLRRELSRSLSLLPMRDGGLTLDFLGDYAMVGVADRAELIAAARVSRRSRDLPIERPASAEDLGRETAPRGDLDMLSGLPAYLVVGLRSRVAAGLALAALKQQLGAAAADAVEWAPFASYRGVEVVRILGRERGGEIALYYALAGDQLVASFNRSVMRWLIEQALDGKLPQPGAKTSSADGQVVFELAPAKKGSLRMLLGWGLAMAALEEATEARAAAEAVLRGVPESAHKPERSAELAAAYLGAAPLTPDGLRYWMSPEGIADPLRGTAHAPEWPALPTAESAAGRLLGALNRIRGDLSFDTEPTNPGAGAPLRSLRARMDFWLR
jgi:hypothetical protein